MSARFLLYRRNGTYYFRWTIPLALRRRMADGVPGDVRLSLRTTSHALARDLAALHWLAAIEARNALLVSNSLIRYKDVLSAIRGRVCMEATPSADDASDQQTSVTLVSLLGTKSPQALTAAIALLSDAGAPLSVYFSGPVNIYADGYDEDDGSRVERVVERLHDWVDEAFLTERDIAAAIASPGYEFTLREFRSNAPGAFETDPGGARIHYRVVPDTPAVYLLADLRTSPRYASLLGRPNDQTPVLTPVPGPPPQATAAIAQTSGALFNERLSILAARWLERMHKPERNRAGWKPKTYREYKAALDQCIEIVGDKNSAELTPADAEDYMRVIERLPRDYFKRREAKYAGRPPVKVAQEVFPEDQLLSPKTLLDKTGMVSQFFEDLSKRGYIGANFFRGLYKLPSDYEAQDRREPFTDAALVAMFSGKGAELLAKSLDRRKKVAVDFWGPLLGLYTGARAGEISQLACGDVALTDGGIPYLRITDNYIDESSKGQRQQTLKTKNSRRDIPLHPTLIELGFLDFAKVQARKGERAPLFPESWTRNDPTRVYQRLSTKFTGLLTALGLKTPKVSFHSFRHTVVQRFRRNSSYLYQAHQFCGHDNGLPAITTMQGTRYGGDFDVAELVPLLDLLDYPIDWADLAAAVEKDRFW